MPLNHNSRTLWFSFHLAPSGSKVGSLFVPLLFPHFSSSLGTAVMASGGKNWSWAGGRSSFWAVGKVCVEFLPQTILEGKVELGFL